MATKRDPQFVTGPTRLTILLGVGIALVMGSVVGLGAYTFVYAKGASYLSNDPRACANCHIMQDHLDGWIKASHRSWRPATIAIRRATCSQSILLKRTTVFFIRSLSLQAAFTILFA